jgi:hypothetical protein
VPFEVEGVQSAGAAGTVKDSCVTVATMLSGIQICTEEGESEEGKKKRSGKGLRTKM